jgi:hypothetical protein
MALDALPAHIQADTTLDQAGATSSLLAANQWVHDARHRHGTGSPAHRYAVRVYQVTLSYLRAANAAARQPGARRPEVAS